MSPMVVEEHTNCGARLAIHRRWNGKPSVWLLGLRLSSSFLLLSSSLCRLAKRQKVEPRGAPLAPPSLINWLVRGENPVGAELPEMDADMADHTTNSLCMCCQPDRGCVARMNV